MGKSFNFVTEIENGKIQLQTALLGGGISVDEEKDCPYGVKYYLSDGAKIVLYFSKGKTSKIYFEKETDKTVEIVSSFALENNKEASSSGKPIPEFSCHIGTDESGKGDYFGPLVIAGVFVTKQDEEKLKLLGVRDSKNNSDKKNMELAEQIIKILGDKKISVVCVGIERYNTLYPQMENVNKILGWGHARAIENLLKYNDCQNAIADQFGNEQIIKRALMERGKTLNLVQTPKAERDIAVASASIIARNRYLLEIAKLSESLGEQIPKGAGENAEILARKIYLDGGREKLLKYVKLHFKTTEKITE